MRLEIINLSKISIIIPTYNEANNLPLLLSDLSILKKEAEILIIDCGSKDKTIDIANIYGAQIYKSKEKNRGLQLHIGAKNAKGEWFIFLHADSRLNQDWFTKLRSVLIENESYFYALNFRINNKKLIYRILEILVNIRSSFLKTPYGDQGLIINSKTYFNNKGYRKIPLMEDLDFIKRLNHKETLRLLRIPIYTSSRKWEENNIFIQTLKNWKLRRRWSKGESIKSIYIDYYKN